MRAYDGENLKDSGNQYEGCWTVSYKGIILSHGYRLDLLVAQTVVGFSTLRFTENCLDIGEYFTYWDGKNAFGEKVSSGTYFYHFRAGDYHTTRRMLILK